VTFEEIGRFAVVEVVNQSSQRVFFDAYFQSVEKHRDELLHILLNHDVDRLTKRFISYAKSVRDEIDSGRLFQIPEYPLNLMQEVVIDFSLLRVKGPDRFFFVIDPQKQVSKGFVHVELLDYRVHVANISQIFQPCVSCGRSLVDLG
jgi:hypothetical protein